MTMEQAREFARKLIEEHPEGCSCGSPDCLSVCEPDYNIVEAEIIRDQTDWRSPRCSEKRQFCKENGIPCI